MQIVSDSGIYKIENMSKVVESPFFFPSISTIRTNHKFEEYLQLLIKTEYPGFLISAYDIYHSENENIFDEVSKLTDNSIFVLMDSGNYEAYWKKDKKWSFNKLDKVLKETNVNLCFSFDIFRKEKDSIKDHVSETIKFTAMTGGSQQSGITIPIIHSEPNEMLDVVEQVVEGINPQIIGIVERELGSNILERAILLTKIRKKLQKMKRDIPIHLLGAGNPVSLLTYFLCGADFFDALEWCKTVVNPKTGHLHHFIQRDLFACDCDACKMKHIPYGIQTMSHNLLFYQQFMNEIQLSYKNKTLKKVIKKYIPKHFIPKLNKIALRL